MKLIGLAELGDEARDERRSGVFRSTAGCQRRRHATIVVRFQPTRIRRREGCFGEVLGGREILLRALRPVHEDDGRGERRHRVRRPIV